LFSRFWQPAPRLNNAAIHPCNPATQGNGPPSHWNITGKKGKRRGENLLKKPLSKQCWLKKSSSCPRDTPHERHWELLRTCLQEDHWPLALFSLSAVNSFKLHLNAFSIVTKQIINIRTYLVSFVVVQQLALALLGLLLGGLAYKTLKQI